MYMYMHRIQVHSVSTASALHNSTILPAGQPAGLVARASGDPASQPASQPAGLVARASGDDTEIAALLF